VPTAGSPEWLELAEALGLDAEPFKKPLTR
jgi:hypothetical protein